ncbi:LPXTG cell wall anchor domain-containing protein [Gemella sp. GH3]|nr:MULTISPECIES: LPXTG cell wall anchor domain-containing protein [unclassified Gemella]MBF0713729.1 LPXTG cell wall anchor domain-containing protein [Gemella sp. GH3.1]NYS50681.1 LPXTG cell wall anchor domain-containing protein [Gemella sp. GH3]
MDLLTVDTLPQTGEIIKNNGLYIGLGLLALIALLLIWKKKKEKEDTDKQ